MEDKVKEAWLPTDEQLSLAAGLQEEKVSETDKEQVDKLDTFESSDNQAPGSRILDPLVDLDTGFAWYPHSNKLFGDTVEPTPPLARVHTPALSVHSAYKSKGDTGPQLSSLGFLLRQSLWG